MVQHGESWYIVTVQYNVKSFSIYHQMIIWTLPDMLDNYCSLLTLWPLSVQHGVSLEVIHGHTRMTSPPHTSRFASNPWRSCGQRKPAIPDSSRNRGVRLQTGMVYKQNVWESPPMMFNSIQQRCSSQTAHPTKFHWASLCWAEMSSNSPNCHGELSGRADQQMTQSTFT